MRKVLYWEAEDGTEFESEEECVRYEVVLTDTSGVRAFNEKFRELDREKDGFDAFCSEAWFYYIEDKEKARGVFERSDSLVGCYGPKEGTYGSGDILCYDENDNEWVNLTRRLNYYSDLYGKVQDAMAKKLPY